MPALLRTVVLLSAAPALLACTGQIARDGATDAPPTAGPVPGPPGARPAGGAGAAGGTSPPAAVTDVGATPLVRLSRLEYDATLRDLLGYTQSASASFPPEATDDAGFFDSVAISPLEVAKLSDAAEAVAAWAVQKIGTLAPCPAGADDVGCADGFIRGFGRRAFRRPLTGDEVAEYLALYKGALAGADRPTAVQTVLTAFLQAPQFLYRFDTPDPTGRRAGKLAPLDGFSVASRLSYFLWKSTPDDALLADAENHRLETPQQVAAAARRLLQDPRAADALALFHTQWLELQPLETLSKDTRLYPSFTDGARQAMRREVAAFVADVLGKGDGKLATLLAAPYSFVNDALAPIYGLPPPRTGTTMTRVDLDPAQRAGLLTMPALMSTRAKPSETSPILRGKLIRERFLCQALPPPPPNLNVTPPAADPNRTTRARYTEHAANPACSGCHTRMDPIGFGFESYDAVGRFRRTEAMLPIDASGTLADAGDASGSFAGAVELARKIAAATDVRRCVGAMWFRFALGRPLGASDDGSFAQSYRQFEASGFDVRELLVALASSPAFRNVSAEGAVSP